ncbi:PREDICTED: ras association domain-containing protein 10 [Cyprinodon variegatus]|uniref:Ras association domain family member 10 n=1 Tax=Cyprinodon variegatus TaxID=28743 RepID=A0A3Q2GNJ4_CYPVA|nr:PREDICTED: ras association domain-containing protein 10 [Cyprinodon variegatus]
MGSASDSKEINISVWVCREEKLVFGLSKRNTCADVVKVLLEEQRAQPGLSTTESHCIVEKWRGFERILPNKTKILKLWIAWGDEQKNVKFVLVKKDASLESRRARSAEARVVPSKQTPGGTKGSTKSNMGSISPEKQRRIVRKAFRKLEKINRKRTRSAHRDAEKMETLVHVVVSQDHTIRQQVQRMSELDAEIDRYEANVHTDRIKRHGVNYVQNTYLFGAASVSAQEGKELNSKETLAKLEEYSRQCEQVLKLQEELLEQEAIIETITAHIQEELNLRWMQRRKEELRSKRAPSQPPCSQTHSASQSEQYMEEERIKTQLDASLYIGLRLNADLEAIRGDLELSQQIGTAKEKEMRDLLEKVNSLNMEEGDADEVTRIHGTEDKEILNDTLKGGNEWAEQAKGLTKPENINDDDSDTGLSSLHSQDSDGLPVWESLV